MQIISGHQLPPSNLSRSNKADPLVRLEIYGVPEDIARHQTSVVKNNGKHKAGQEVQEFTPITLNAYGLALL